MPRHAFGSEIKGEKLLRRSRFKYARRSDELSKEDRKSLTAGFLKSTTQGKPPRAGEQRAYCETCLAFSLEVLKSLEAFDCVLFAAFIPPEKPPKDAPASDDFLRKDHVFLLERYYYFLESKKARGLIVMDGIEKTSDRRFIKGLERYFQHTKTGQDRSKRIVPVPFFVESDMGYGVQVADLCIYCLNWAYRVPHTGLDADCRTELLPYAELLQSRIWDKVIRKNRQRHRIRSVVFVPDPYTSRRIEG